jgi:hypothetical protein
MPATMSPPTAERARDAAPRSEHAEHTPMPRGRPCPYCRAAIAEEARKCRHCGEWVVSTSRGAAAALLRVVGWLWVGASLLGAAALWQVASATRSRILATVVDEGLTPALLDALAYIAVALAILQGLTFGLALAVLASLAPRRPRWWR